MKVFDVRKIIKEELLREMQVPTELANMITAFEPYLKFVQKQVKDGIWDKREEEKAKHLSGILDSYIEYYNRK